MTEGASPAIANLDADSLAAAEAAQSTTLAAVLAREDGGEPPSFELGTGVSSSKLCVVLNGVPNGELCTLSLVVDDERVHATDLGEPPVLPNGQFPVNDKVPLLVGLTAVFGQGTAEPVLSASWFPTAGAIYYIAEISYDGGVTWAQIYEGQGNQFVAVVTAAALSLRVQAVNSTIKGPFSSVSVQAPTIVIASQTVALKSLIEGLQYQVTTLQDQVKSQADQVTQLLASVSASVASRTWLDKKQLRSELFAQAGDAKASIAELQTVVVDQQTAFAEFSTEVSATFGDAFSSVKTVTSAVAQLDGYAAASWGVSIDINGNIAGIELVNGTDAESSFRVLADHFQVAIPGADPVPVFTTGTIAGVPTVGINGDLILTGTITASMLKVGTLSAISANLGDVKAGTLSDPNGTKMVMDLNNGFLDIFDNS